MSNNVIPTTKTKTTESGGTYSTKRTVPYQKYCDVVVVPGTR